MINDLATHVHKHAGLIMLIVWLSMVILLVWVSMYYI